MADNNAVEVPVDVDITDLNTGIRDLLTGFKEVLNQAQGLENVFKNSSNSITPFVNKVTELRKELVSAKNEAEKLRVGGLISRNNDDLASASRVTKQLLDELRTAQSARGVAREQISRAPNQVGPGTLGDARLANELVQAQITAINSTTEQVAARLADAAGKASERLIKTSAAALQARMETANISTLSSVARTAVPGLTEASVTQARIAAQKRVAQFSGVSNYQDVLDQKDAESNLAIIERIKRNSFNKVLRENMAATRDAQKEQQSEEEKNQKYLQSIKQRYFLQQQREEERAQKAAARPGPMSVQERVDKANEFRTASIESNGGADFFAFQSKIAANYMLFSTAIQGLKAGIQNLVQFDDTLLQFQAITQTSTTELAGFRKGLLDLGETSRYSVSDLAAVAVQLGQIGLSAPDVIKALPAAMNLAAASGTDLKNSVTILTSALGAFNLSATQSNNVADIFVGTLNATRLNVDQLGAALQYAGTIAHDSGISLSELTSAAGGLAQSGIKNGSTIGTGLRQLIEELTAPSAQLLKTMQQLGISLSDIDIRSNTLTGVLENLKAKGFDTATALRTLDLRAASAFSALNGQTDRIKRMQETILLSNAAAEGANTANQSLIASLNRLGNSIFSVIDRGFTPFVSIVGKSLDAIAGLVSGFTLLGPILPVIATGMAGIATAAAAMRIGGLLAGLSGPVLASLTAVATNPVLLGVGAAVGVLGYLSSLETAAEKASRKVQELKEVQNGLTSTSTNITTNIENVNSRISNLQLQKDKLNSDPILFRNTVLEAQKSFADIGLSIEGNVNSVDKLIEAYRRLNDQLRDQKDINSQQQLNAGRREVDALQQQNEITRRGVGWRIGSSIGSDATGPNIQRRLQELGFGSLNDLPSMLNGGIDANNPNGPGTVDMYNRINSLRTDRSSKRDNAALNGDRGGTFFDTEYDKAVRDIEILDKLEKILKDEIGRVANVKAAQGKVREATNSIEVGNISNKFSIMTEGAESEQNRLISANLAVTNNKNLSAIDQRNAMINNIRGSQDWAKGQLGSLDDQSAALIASGKPPEQVREATTKLRDVLTALINGTSKQLEDMMKTLDPRARALYESQKREQETQLTNLNKRAANTRDPGELTEIGTLIEDRIKKIQDLDIEIIKLTFANSDNVLNNPELKNQIGAVEGRTTTEIDTAREKLREIRKKLVEQELSFRSNVLEAKRQSDMSEVARLEKILKDASTTPEKAKELVEQINKFLDSAKAIALQQSEIALQKNSLNLPGGTIAAPNITNAPTGTVAAQVIDALRQRNQSGLTDYFLGSAERESQFNPRASNPSGATGLFQFMPKTWTGAGGGDIYSVVDQVNNMIKFTQANIDTFKAQLGREPTDPEKYLLHQQGAGGGIGLLRGGNASAASIVGAGAVTGNGGTLDMTATEFANHIMRQFTTSYDRVAGRYTTTAVEQQRQRTTDETAKIETEDEKRRAEVRRAEIEVNRRAELSNLALVDKNLTGTLQTQQSLTRSATSPGEVVNASTSAVNTISELFRKALEADDLNKRGEGRSETDKALGRGRIQDTYRETAERQAISGAEAVGKQTLRDYEDKVKSLQAQLTTYNNPLNANKFSQEQIDATQKALTIAQERLKVEGEFEATGARIAELERARKQIVEAGLGDENKLLSINEQIAAQKVKQAELQGQVNLKTQAGAAQPSLGNAVGGAVIDFEKSRGIRNSLGELVDDATMARKQLNEVLGGIGSSFDSFFTNIFSGTKTAGEAFKDFAKSILSNLASMASKALTNQLFGSLFGTASGGSGGGIFSSIIGAVTGGMNNGGSVPVRFAAGGSVPNNIGVPTRDSVNAVVRPGEFIMRNSAVETIGRDKLEAMNALGATVIDKGAENIANAGNQKPPAGKAEANVYIMEREQTPTLGPTDVLHIIGSDIKRGGAIKQLIRSVATN